MQGRALHVTPDNQREVTESLPAGTKENEEDWMMTTERYLREREKKEREQKVGVSSGYME